MTQPHTRTSTTFEVCMTKLAGTSDIYDDRLSVQMLSGTEVMTGATARRTYDARRSFLRDPLAADHAAPQMERHGCADAQPAMGRPR